MTTSVSTFRAKYAAFKIAVIEQRTSLKELAKILIHLITLC